MAADANQVQRRLITVDEYEQMIRAGVFKEDDRLELIDGVSLLMSAIGSAHAATVNRINGGMVRRCARKAQVSIQNPIRLAESEPQPDVALLNPRADYYAQALPGATDVLLLIEVADTTQAFDRGVKIPLYARNRIREAWLIDLQEGVIEVYREPATSGYRAKQTHAAGERLTPELLPDVQVGVDEMLTP